MAKARLAAYYKVPMEVFVFESLPRNALGKVVKPETLRVLGGGMLSWNVIVTGRKPG